MNFEVSISDSGNPVSDQMFDGIKIAAQDAMAIAFSDVVLNNFGSDGEDRPKEWRLLTPNYANEFHDGDQTPTLVLTGEARSSIDVSLGRSESATCYSDNEYLTDHQWGNAEKRLPPRPVFPVDGDENDFRLTDYTEQKVVAAAERAILEKLQ